MKKNYIKAICDLIRNGSDIDVVLKKLSVLLKEKGHESIHVAILEGVYKELTAFTGTSTVLTLRTHFDATLYAEAIATDFANLGTTEKPTIKEDDTIIGGYIVEHDHKRIDKSHKSQLVTLYRNITR